MEPNTEKFCVMPVKIHQQLRVSTILQNFVSLRPKKKKSNNYPTIHSIICTLDITLTLRVEMRCVFFVLEHLSLLS